jgi:hypothetical protein
MPVSFLDLVPKRPTSTVTIEAEDGERVPFEVTGVPLAQLAEISRKYPSLGRVLDGSAGIITASDAMPALVAAALGHHGDAQYEQHAMTLPPDVLLALSGEIVRLTFPRNPIVAPGENEPALVEGVNGAQPAAILPQRLNS